MTNKNRLYEGCVSFSSAFVTSFGFLKDFRERANKRMREWAAPGAAVVLSEGRQASKRSTSTVFYLLLKHFLHNNDSKTGVSVFCAWWWHKMQSTQLQQIQSNFRWFFIYRPSFSVSPSLTSLSSSPPPTSPLPSQIPASIFLACVKLSDKKEFGLNDFIEKEIQYKDCLEKSFVVVIRYYKIYFYSKIIGSLFCTNLGEWRAPVCQVVTYWL